MYVSGVASLFVYNALKWNRLHSCRKGDGRLRSGELELLFSSFNNSRLSVLLSLLNFVRTGGGALTKRSTCISTSRLRSAWGSFTLASLNKNLLLFHLLIVYLYISHSVSPIKKGAKKHKGMNAARGIGPIVGGSFSISGDAASVGRSVDLEVAVTDSVKVRVMVYAISDGIGMAMIVRLIVKTFVCVRLFLL